MDGRVIAAEELADDRERRVHERRQRYIATWRGSAMCAPPPRAQVGGRMRKKSHTAFWIDSMVIAAVIWSDGSVAETLAGEVDRDRATC